MAMLYKETVYVVPTLIKHLINFEIYSRHMSLNTYKALKDYLKSQKFPFNFTNFETVLNFEAFFFLNK